MATPAETARSAKGMPIDRRTPGEEFAVMDLISFRPFKDAAQYIIRCSALSSQKCSNSSFL
jgi:hypothetical protein